MGNMVSLGNIPQEIIRRLTGKMPPGWRITMESPSKRLDRVIDAVLRINGPSSTSGLLLMQVKSHMAPKDVDDLSEIAVSKDPFPTVIAAPFLSKPAQERLAARGFGYADLTGNIRLSLSKPVLYIEARGADKNPDPTIRERRSLKGAKAGRLIRTLCDYKPPIGVRQLAKAAGVDAGYVSRVVDYLDRETLVIREPRGGITRMDWAGLLRRWSQEYSPFLRGPSSMVSRTARS